MAYSSNDSPDHQIPWLPNERFEMALDARLGMTTSPTPGENVLTITTQRVIKLGSDTGKRTTSMVPLDRVTAVEIIDAARPSERLTQGLIAFAIGLILGLISHVLFAEPLITLILGGLPILISIYILMGYAFPDAEGELILHVGAYALRQPLLAPEARRDAYLAAHRIYDLVAEIQAGSVPENAHPSPRMSQVDEASGIGKGPAPTPARWRPATPGPQQESHASHVWGLGSAGSASHVGTPSGMTQEVTGRPRISDNGSDESIAAEEQRRDELAPPGERLLEQGEDADNNRTREGESGRGTATRDTYPLRSDQEGEREQPRGQE